MRKYLLFASAYALALTSPAFAEEGISFDAAGSFGNIAGFPSWNVGGEANVPLGIDDLSVDGAIKESGVSRVHVFSGAGSLMWSGDDFRLAGTVNYNRISIANKDANETQIGGAAQWFATPWLTATVGGGGLAGDASGGYVSGNLKGYVCPDAALDGFVSYQSISKAQLIDFGVHAEYLPFEQLPISLGATYDHVAQTGSGHGSTDTWSIGVKLYLNDFGASTLEDRQRHGTLDTMRPSLLFIF